MLRLSILMLLPVIQVLIVTYSSKVNVLHRHPKNQTSSKMAFSLSMATGINNFDLKFRLYLPSADTNECIQFYVPMLYGLLGIKYRINDIVIVFFSKTNGKIRLNPLDGWHMSMFILGKTFFVFYRIILPAYYFGVMKSLLLFVYSDVITSFVLAFVFQVNHVVTQVSANFFK